MNVRWSRVAVIVLIAGGLVLGTVLASRFGADPEAAPSPLLGRPAPDVTVEMLEDGSPLALSSLRGGVAVINFWASWCVPCRAEHGELLFIASAYAPAGVRVLGIAYQDRRGSVIDFLDELGRGYDVALDDRSRAAIGFGVRGVPETFVLDTEGMIVARISGPVDRILLGATIERILVGQEVEDDVTTGTTQRQAGD